jgi:5'-nucleotidase
LANSRPTALVTNDDGIESFFLHALIRGMQEHFDVTVVAPAGEQSWVSRRMTRHGKVEIEPYPGLDCRAWRLHGTPSDCVNIAIGHLMEKRPDVVVSGINIGYNATETLIFSSGTVAAALEAAVWRIPALAVSKWLPKQIWEAVRLGQPEGKQVELSVAQDGRRAGAFAQTLVGKTSRDMLVHNLNFPIESDEHTPIVTTRPAPLFLGSLFEMKPEGHFEFTYAKGEVLDDAEDTDIATLFSGKISYSLLNFSAVSQAPLNK